MTHEHDEHCNCENHANEEEMEWFEVEDEDGKVHRFLLEAVVELDEKSYAIMVPEDELESDDPSLAIFLLDTDEEGNEVLYGVDDEEAQRVLEALDELEEEGEDEDEKE